MKSSLFEGESVYTISSFENSMSKLTTQKQDFLQDPGVFASRIDLAAIKC